MHIIEGMEQELVGMELEIDVFIIICVIEFTFDLHSNYINISSSVQIYETITLT